VAIWPASGGGAAPTAGTARLLDSPAVALLLAGFAKRGLVALCETTDAALLLVVCATDVPFRVAVVAEMGCGLLVGMGCDDSRSPLLLLLLLDERDV
jgi:hypothetical protein